jgi:hypothetical protein
MIWPGRRVLHRLRCAVVPPTLRGLLCHRLAPTVRLGNDTDLRRSQMTLREISSFAAGQSLAI